MVPELTNSFSAASLAVFNSTATNSTIWKGEQGNIIKLKLDIQKSSIKSVSGANKSFKLHYEYCISLKKIGHELRTYDSQRC
jgi:hypothetical protein